MMKTKLSLLLLFILPLCCCIEERGEGDIGDYTSIVTTVIYGDNDSSPSTTLPEDSSMIKARQRMVEYDLKGRDIDDKGVLAAMGKVERHRFVGEDLQDQAYADHPLPIGYGQTISQPYIVALMTQSLKLEDSDRVLEVGTGSGYQAAILCELVDETYSIEIIDELAKKANKTLTANGFRANVKSGDGYFGWEEHAPFDAIIITCAATHIPPPLIEQLNEGGRLIIPLGSTKYHQTLTLTTKVNNSLKTEYITGVRFVPMTGKAQKT